MIVVRMREKHHNIFPRSVRTRERLIEKFDAAEIIKAHINEERFLAGIDHREFIDAVSKVEIIDRITAMEDAGKILAEQEIGGIGDLGITDQLFDRGPISFFVRETNLLVLVVLTKRGESIETALGRVVGMRIVVW